jgi:hypothetical protein
MRGIRPLSAGAGQAPALSFPFHFVRGACGAAEPGNPREGAPPLSLTRGARVSSPPQLPRSRKQASGNRTLLNNITERTDECARAYTKARQELAIQREKLLTAPRPRTYTHPTRPVILLGPPSALAQPAPTGQALWFTLLAAFMFTWEVAPDLT